jgi:hypothetical protein
MWSSSSAPCTFPVAKNRNCSLIFCRHTLTLAVVVQNEALLNEVTFTSITDSQLIAAAVLGNVSMRLAQAYDLNAILADFAILLCRTSFANKCAYRNRLRCDPARTVKLEVLLAPAAFTYSISCTHGSQSARDEVTVNVGVPSSGGGGGSSSGGGGSLDLTSVRALLTVWGLLRRRCRATFRINEEALRCVHRCRHHNEGRAHACRSLHHGNSTNGPGLSLTSQ